MPEFPVVVCIRCTVVEAASADDARAAAKAAIADMLQLGLIHIDENGTQPAPFGVRDLAVSSASLIGEHP